MSLECVGRAATVDGRRCWADEARFGGIVVQPRPADDPPRINRREASQ